MSKKKKNVAIVVPTYKEILTPDEEISLRHLRHFLGDYDKYLFIPDDLAITIKHDDFIVKRLPKRYFLSKGDYSRLLLSKKFYEAFNSYEYILIYQLDSLVFSDQLLEWCEKGYDYIGAPWYKTETMKASGWVIDEDSVGNGGFSLRKVESHLKALAIYQSHFNIAKRKLIPCLYLFKYYLSRIPKKILDLITRKQSLLSVFKNAYIQKKNTDYQHPSEDSFWSFEAKKYYPDFKIPPTDVALSFSFEVAPRYCFEKNNRTLPFGCHAWAKYDRAFWEPHILKSCKNRGQERPTSYTV